MGIHAFVLYMLGLYMQPSRLIAINQSVSHASTIIYDRFIVAFGMLTPQPPWRLHMVLIKYQFLYRLTWYQYAN